ncbi:hypothetical protein A2U01_0003402, partial [Trifolium medium]|nr:hypothetical protein [Trifolium medium]
MLELQQLMPWERVGCCGCLENVKQILWVASVPGAA